MASSSNPSLASQHIESTHAAPFYVNRLPMMPRSAPFPCRGLSLADILGSDGSQWSVVIAANYMIDFEWLLRAAPALLTVDRLVLLSGEKSNEHILGYAATAGMRRAPIVVSPPLPIPYGTHHTKCLICLGDRGVRVAIGTANFICDDWERKNQGIYVQDFPRRNGAPAAVGDGGAGEDYVRALSDYLSKSGVNSSIVQQLTSDYDFSFPAVDLVPSVPGIHKATEMVKYGFVRLQGLLERLDAQQQQLIAGAAGAAPQSLNLSWQYSSQGSLTLPFLKDLTTAMLGGPNGRGNRDLGDRVRIDVHFPTEGQVRESVEGWRGGSSIPVPIKNCHEFINCRLHRWGHRTAPGGGGLGAHPRNHAMPHIKSYSRFHRIVGTGGGSLDWFLLTSSNLSRAAWGEYQRGGLQVQIRSYELGVLFHPVRLAKWWAHNEAAYGGAFCCTREPLGGGHHHYQDRSSSAASELLTDTTGGLKIHHFRRLQDASAAAFHIALPYSIFNPEPYASTAQLQAGGGGVSSRDVPWVIDVPHRGPDCFGLTIETLGEYSHYGPASWRAPTKHFEHWTPAPADCRPGREHHAVSRPQDSTNGTSGIKNRGPHEVIDVDAEDECIAVVAAPPTQPSDASCNVSSSRKRFREVM
jgi:tyrosyl-DNA phosphodiesterase 1